MAKTDGENKRVISPTAVPTRGDYMAPLMSASKVTAAARTARPMEAPKLQSPTATVSLAAYHAALKKILSGEG